MPEQQKALRRIRRLPMTPYGISRNLADCGVKLSHVIIRKIIAGRQPAA